MNTREWLQYQSSFLEELQFYANLDKELKIHPEEQALCQLIMTRAKDFLSRRNLPLKPSPASTAANPSHGSSNPP
jgi:hypothetical protein